MSFKLLFNTFPREMGNPRRIPVRNISSMLEFINSSNGMASIYSSVYSYTLDDKGNIEYTNPIIDKVYFDFDTDDCYEHTLKLHNYLYSQDLRHCIIFSGRGYNIYIFVEKTFLKDKKNAIGNAQRFLVEKLGLEVDKQIISDIRRISRVPNTYNVKREKFCIPLTREEFLKGDEYIRKLADNQHIILDYVIGDKLWDIVEFDNMSAPLRIDNGDFIELTTKNPAGLNGDIPMCIKQILSNENMGWQERRILIIWLRDNSYLIEECIGILEEHLSPKKFKHCMSADDGRQPFYLYKRDNMFFPNCETLYSDGFCPFPDPRQCNSKTKELYGRK